MKDGTPPAPVDAVALADGDTVATALRALAAGDSVRVRIGGTVREWTLRDSVPFGHKFALAPMSEGTDVVKSGTAIGRATRAIESGQHVHVHNLVSARARPKTTG